MVILLHSYCPIDTGLPQFGHHKFLKVRWNFVRQALGACYLWRKSPEKLSTYNFTHKQTTYKYFCAWILVCTIYKTDSTIINVKILFYGCYWKKNASTGHYFGYQRWSFCSHLNNTTILLTLNCASFVQMLLIPPVKKSWPLTINELSVFLTFLHLSPSFSLALKCNLCIVPESHIKK